MPKLNYSSLFLSALKDLFRPRVLLALFLPFVFSLGIWTLIAILSWDNINQLIASILQWSAIQSLMSIAPWLTSFLGGTIGFIIKTVFILAVVLPLMAITATILISIFLVPVLVSELRTNQFPNLKKHSSSIFSGTLTTIGFSIKYFFSWLGSVPLWFIPFGAFIVPFLLLSWFNSRVFTFEVLTEVASKSEIQQFVESHSRTLFILGCLTSLVYWIPGLNLVAPLVASAVFSRYCIGQYAEDREV